MSRQRLRQFPRESLIARPSSVEASIVKVELADARASLTLTTRIEPHNRRAIHAEPEVNPTRVRTGRGYFEDTGWVRTFADRTRPPHWLGADTAAVWLGHGQRLFAARVAVRTRTVFGLNAVADWIRPRPAGRPIVAYSGDIPPPNRDYFADAESFASEGVRLVCVKCLQVKATKGGECA